MSGVFDNSSLKVSEKYASPKVTVSSVIPFTILKNDILQLDYDPAMTITNSGLSPLQISLFRGGTYVNFLVDSSTSTSTFFKGNLKETSEASTSSEFRFIFDIATPPSQKPWTVLMWLRRNSGAYVKITVILQAYAVTVGTNKATVSAAST